MYSESSTFPNFYQLTNIIVLKDLLLISWLCVETQKRIHEKIYFPTVLNLLKIKKNWEIFLVDIAKKKVFWWILPRRGFKTSQ